MSQSATLARPYARAAFETARDGGRLAQWSRLFGFSSQLAAAPAMIAALIDPRLDAATAAVLLVPEGEIDPSFRQFVTVLAENGRVTELPEVARLFEALRAAEEKKVRVRITSAQALSEEDRNKLTSALKIRFNADVDVTEAVDESLIGGAVIDVGDVVIDGSVRGRLQRLQTELG